MRSASDLIITGLYVSVVGLAGMLGGWLLDSPLVFWAGLLIWLGGGGLVLWGHRVGRDRGFPGE